WAGLVIDEAQFAKNRATQVYDALARVRAPFRLAITGTPVENSLDDLWALLSLTAPGLFPSPVVFRETFTKPIARGTAPHRLALLRRRIRPFVLRRTKEQVVEELPPKQEQVRTVDLLAEHRRVYDAVLQRERKKVLGLLEDLREPGMDRGASSSSGRSRCCGCSRSTRRSSTTVSTRGSCPPSSMRCWRTWIVCWGS